MKRQKREVTVDFENLENEDALEHLAAEFGKLAADLCLSGLLKSAEREPEREEAAA